MKCPNCGKEFNEKVKFCDECGEKIEKEEYNLEEDETVNEIEEYEEDDKEQFIEEKNKKKNKGLIITIIILIVIIFLLVGFGIWYFVISDDNKKETKKDSVEKNEIIQKEKEGTVECRFSNNYDDYIIESTYKYQYKGKYSTVVNSQEIVTSNNNDTLDYFKTTLEKQYKDVKDKYGGYTYEIKKESNNKIVSTVSIDYSKMDLDKFLEDEPSFAYYLEDGKILSERLKAMYISIGATCEEY